MAAVTEVISLENVSEEEITRFDIHQIIQHAVLMVSFILLVLTGLPLKFSSATISQLWVAVLGGIEVTRSIHHFAAWVMVGVSLYHVIYIAYSILILKKPFPVKMVPSGQDFLKLFQELGYFAGLIKERPKFDRFNWKEKFDRYRLCRPRYCSNLQSNLV